MVVISNEKNSILTYTDDVNLSYWSNGYPFITSTKVAYIADEVNVYENVEVPEEIEPHKHCYTPEKGFYINPDWVEPTPPDPKNIYNVPDDIYHNIIDDYTVETLMQEV